MRLLPEGIDEMSATYRWGVEWRLRIIEEVICAPPTSGTGGPGIEELMERARPAARRGDREAEDAAFVDGMRAEVRDGWKDFREHRLLADLYRRTALRRESGRSRDDDDRRFPTHGAGGPPGCQGNAGRHRGCAPVPVVKGCGKREAHTLICS